MLTRATVIMTKVDFFSLTKLKDNTISSSTRVRLFLTYARSDDEAFVRRVYDGSTTAKFEAYLPGRASVGSQA